MKATEQNISRMLVNFANSYVAPPLRREALERLLEITEACIEAGGDNAVQVCKEQLNAWAARVVAEKGKS